MVNLSKSLELILAIDYEIHRIQSILLMFSRVLYKLIARTFFSFELIPMD